MSAVYLRETAALMRERAEAATGATYHWRTGKVSKPGRGLVACGAVQIASTDETLGGADYNAEHIASWHPAVALAVADWLDEIADTPGFNVWDSAGRGHLNAIIRGAKAVARAYRGDAS